MVMIRELGMYVHLKFYSKFLRISKNISAISIVWTEKIYKYVRTIHTYNSYVRFVFFDVRHFSVESAFYHVFAQTSMIIDPSYINDQENFLQPGLQNSFLVS